MLIKIFEVIFLMFVVDFLPVALVTLAVRSALKKKLSKIWCILVFILCVFVSFLLGTLITGHSVKPGLLDFIIPLVVINIFLYEPESQNKQINTETMQK